MHLFKYLVITLKFVFYHTKERLLKKNVQYVWYDLECNCFMCTNEFFDEK